MKQIDETRAYEAGQAVVETHRRLAASLRVGITLAEIDAFVAKTLEALRTRSCFFGYRVPGSPRFPSHACLSVNECVVHGTATYYTEPLKIGDVLKIDIGLLRKGWIGDAAWTYVFGEMTDDVRALTDCGKETIRRGVDALQPGQRLLEWARVVQDYVEGECRLHLIRGYGGHGYGKSLHTAPFISNVVPKLKRDWPDAEIILEPGLLIAVEPMIAIGTGKTRQENGKWPIYTRDGSLSVHYEHDVLITQDGPRLMTDGLQHVEDVILR